LPISPLSERKSPALGAIGQPDHCGASFTEHLEPLFTGLGFVAILATLIHERSKTVAAEREHAEVLAEMRRNTEMSTQANRIAVIVARISYLTARIDEANQSGMTRGLSAFGPRAEPKWSGCPFPP
jgi:hypothetical protein